MKIIKLLFFNLLFISNYLMATEEPDFNLVKKIENFEIREYSPKILAQVKIKGNFDDASNQGFKILADYIFGNNISIDGNSKIEMTAPVVVEPISEVMAMTAPVISEGTNKEWIVSFVMPNEYSLETLPRPNNKNIKITSLPKERYVAIVFSGLIRESSYIKQIKYLEEFIAKYRIEAIGKIQIARYDPPWVLPFFRRNELMIKIK